MASEHTEGFTPETLMISARIAEAIVILRKKVHENEATEEEHELYNMLTHPDIKVMYDAAAELFKPRVGIRTKLKKVVGWDVWVKSVNVFSISWNDDKTAGALKVIPIDTEFEKIAAMASKMSIGIDSVYGRSADKKHKSSSSDDNNSKRKKKTPTQESGGDAGSDAMTEDEPTPADKKTKGPTFKRQPLSIDYITSVMLSYAKNSNKQLH